MTIQKMTKLETINMKNLIKELKERWVAETPYFWKRVMSFSIAIGSSAVAVIGAEKLFDLQNYGVPQIIFTVAGYIIVAAAAAGLLAKITKTDTTDAINDNKRSRYDKHRHCDGCDEYDA